jgi:transcriptional regulator with XRE-family HTH domain
MVAHVLVLDSTKLTEARGRISVQQLSAYEKGHYRPKPESLPLLLDALGVEFEQVASPLPAPKVGRKRTAARQSTGRS